MQVVLLTESCTTGWAHWGHGELWLTPDSLVRVGRRDLTVKAALGGAPGGALGAVAGPAGHVAGLVATALLADPARHGVGRPVEVDTGDWELNLMQRRRHVLSVPLRWIARADLREGFITTRLGVRTTDGARSKLLWMNNDVAAAPLRAALGDRLHVS